MEPAALRFGLTAPTRPERMSRALAATVLIAALAAGLTVMAAAPVQAAQAARPVRILPLGDSITEGFGASHSTWRYFLWHRLRSSGRDVNFVGNEYGIHEGLPLHADFDQSHEGHSGWKADRILANARAYAARTRPDVVLLHVGTNDVKQRETNATTITEIRGIIRELRVARPRVAVVLAQLIPLRNRDDVIQRLNDRIAALAAELSRPDSRVVTVDQHARFDLAVHSDDGTHPNLRGDRLMARRWARALQPLVKKVALVTLVTTAAPSTLPAGASVRLAARVRTHARVRMVRFYHGDHLIGADRTAPYRVTWRGLPRGRFPVIARAQLESGRVVHALTTFVRAGIPPLALFVVGSPRDLGPHDGRLGARLQGMGLVPVVQDDGDAAASDARGKSVILLSGSISRRRPALAYVRAPVPLMTWDAELMDELGMTRRAGIAPGRQRVQMVRVRHPLTAGLRGRPVVTRVPGGQTYGRPGRRALVTARVVRSPGRAALFAYGRGTRMVERRAPHRRLGFFTTAKSGADLTRAGRRLFDAAVRWSVGRR